jgi:hypothetical protein
VLYLVYENDLTAQDVPSQFLGWSTQWLTVRSARRLGERPDAITIGTAQVVAG